MPRRRSRNVGASCPGKAVGAAVMMPSANSEAMGIQLAEISSQIAPGVHSIVLCDGADWHQTDGALTLPSNLFLPSSPPCAPAPNSLENAWDDLRGNQPGLQTSGTYDDIVPACTKAWRSRINDQQRIMPAHVGPPFVGQRGLFL